MTKTQILVILVLVLLLLNAATLAFFVKGNHHGPPPHGRREAGPKNIVIKKLSFNAEQIAAYEQLIVEHRLAINKNDSLMFVARHKLYKQLVKPDLAQIEFQLQAIGKLQKEVDSLHFQHFQALKAICTDGQLPAFYELVDELSTFFVKNKPLNKHSRHINTHASY